MSRRWLLMLGLLLPASLAQAQDQALDSVRAQLLLPAIDSGRFRQQRELALFPNPLISQGQFVHVRARGLLWQVQQPLQSELRVLNGQVQQRTADGDWSPPLLGAQGSQVAAHLLGSLLSGDLEGLSRHFEMSAQLDEQGWVLQLVPLSSTVREMLRSATVRGGQQVRRLNIEFASKERMLIELNHDAEAVLNPAQKQALELES